VSLGNGFVVAVFCFVLDASAIGAEVAAGSPRRRRNVALMTPRSVRKLCPVGGEELPGAASRLSPATHSAPGDLRPAIASRAQRLPSITAPCAVSDGTLRPRARLRALLGQFGAISRGAPRQARVVRRPRRAENQPRALQHVPTISNAHVSANLKTATLTAPIEVRRATPCGARRRGQPGLEYRWGISPRLTRATRPGGQASPRGEQQRAAAGGDPRQSGQEMR
jgi:hypothetical protein